MPKNIFNAANDNNAATSDTAIKQTASSPKSQQAIPDNHEQLSTIVSVLAKNAAREWFDSLRAANDNTEPTGDMEDIRVSISDTVDQSISPATSNPVSSSRDEQPGSINNLDDIQLSDNALDQGLNDSRFNSIFGEF